jgi:predicted O-methyltransferase YrrM
VPPLKFIGDLSLTDAALLERHARQATRVLEFGVGGSTQILAQSIPEGAKLLSLETDPAWIALTQERLAKLGVAHRALIVRYEGWMQTACDVSPSYDLIFDDGVDHLRREFALMAWPLLEPGGFLIFHDTRRIGDFLNVTWLMQSYFTEIEEVHCNQRAGGLPSNLTVVKKRDPEPYVDWRQIECKPAWMYGTGEVPEAFWEA